MLDDKLLDSLPVEADDGLAAASWLDRALNNTSIVFVLEVADIRMLFAGDAQWGVWREILQDPDARALLARTNLYKVSHHGSHNGSPKTLVNEVLPASLTAMMSFRTMSRWTAIPKTELVDRADRRGPDLAASGRRRIRHARRPPGPRRVVDRGRPRLGEGRRTRFLEWRAGSSRARGVSTPTG